MVVSLEKAGAALSLNLVGGEPEIFHCHHYNTVLQQSIEDGGADVADDLIRDGGAIVAHAQLAPVLRGIAPAEGLRFAADHFRRSGFGVLALDGLGPKGGKARATSSHYALGFRSRKMARTAPACGFVAGFIAGALSAAHGLPPGAFDVRETSCACLTGAKECAFEAKLLAKPRALPASVGKGQTLASLPARKALATSVDEPKILGALATIPFEGNEEGLIPAFGLYLTRHYANYYNYISYEFERRLAARSAHLSDAAREVLVEAGHACAFNTFGGIMESPEWEGLVKPMCRTKEDWASGIVACVNAFGWGRWTVQELVPDQRLVVRIDGSYESNYYLAAHGKSDRSRCYLATGGTAGIMNLIYIGNIMSKPVLDLAFYETLFSGPESFRGVETKCRSKGDPHCEFVAERRSFARA